MTEPQHHHRKLIDALVSPLKRSSDELWQPDEVVRTLRDSDEFWPELEQEPTEMERLWRDRI
jgi:hypothetical protein